MVCSHIRKAQFKTGDLYVEVLLLFWFVSLLEFFD